MSKKKDPSGHNFEVLKFYVNTNLSKLAPKGLISMLPSFQDDLRKSLFKATDAVLEIVVKNEGNKVGDILTSALEYESLQQLHVKTDRLALSEVQAISKAISGSKSLEVFFLVIADMLEEKEVIEELKSLTTQVQMGVSTRPQGAVVTWIEPAEGGSTRCYAYEMKYNGDTYSSVHSNTITISAQGEDVEVAGDGDSSGSGSCCCVVM